MRALPFLFLFAAALPLHAQSVKLTPSDAGLKVEVNGALFTEYITKNTPRPFMYPVIGAAGENITRNFPMRTDVAGEPTDHKHHRSLWFAHGSINGMDFWSEEKNFGKQEHVSFGETKSEGDKGFFTADTKWVAPNGAVQLTDSRKITITALPEGEKLLDFDITLKASEGDVVFGDTKEGSMALRLCSSLSLSAKIEGAKGHAFNSGDDRNAQVWGKHANWVSYYGPDPKGTEVAVSILSHPSNLRSPTTWHARDYGLFAVNPFGLHDFDPTLAEHAGDYTLKKGESLTLRYRFYFAKGKSRPAELEKLFKDYSSQ